MGKTKILVLDDDRMVRWALSQALLGWGYVPVEADTVASAIVTFESELPTVALLDVNLPDGSGITVLQAIKNRQPHTIVIMMTGDVLVDDILAALRGGAYDFVGKPLQFEELQVTIRNGLETQQLRREVAVARRERAQGFRFDQIIGESPSVRNMIALAKKVATSEVSSVLLQGESGTGKDLIAKAIHFESSRATGPFVAINCAAIPANLIESELFGYEKGAFTDAKARKEGIFEQAEGGTLFLDEIGELELALQAKLLRVLEDGAFRRVGGLKDLPLDVRIIAASNRDLRTDSDGGRFRLDLYYRLSVIQIDIPPLCERGDDVLLLTHHFLRLFGERMRKHLTSITGEVAEAFRRYRWPGNVRELRNVVERAMILEDGDSITTTYLPRGIIHRHVGFAADSTAPKRGSRPVFQLPPEGILLDDVEDSFVRQALARTSGVQTRAAELLGITRDQLRYRLKKMRAEAMVSD